MSLETILFWGPSGAGKRTNITALAKTEHAQHVYLTAEGAGDDTHDCAQLERATRVIFVADSSPANADANVTSWKAFHRCLGLSEKQIGGVIQLNKRDLDDALPVEALQDQLGIGPFIEFMGRKLANPAVVPRAELIEAIALRGEGVGETVDCLLETIEENEDSTDEVATASVTPIALEQLDRIVVEEISSRLGFGPENADLLKNLLGGSTDPRDQERLSAMVRERAEAAFFESDFFTTTLERALESFDPPPDHGSTPS